ncbi:MAG: hypothetical protein K2I74_04575 [Treponemataceae bacterium]|nr:hypothetical protein [Treponemataceae bacterium]
MNRKILVAAVAAVICSAAAGAEGFFDGKPLYAKVALGYEMRSVDVPYNYVGNNADDYVTASQSVSFFKLKPSAGMVLFPEHDNFFLKGLAVEVGLDFGFGGKDIGYAGYGIDAFVFTLVPGARAVWNAMIPESRFIPRAFVGFEIPISFVSSEITGVPKLDGAGWRDVSGGFDIDMGVGVTFNLTEKIGILADFTGFFGTSNGFSFTAGASYRFK